MDHHLGAAPGCDSARKSSRSLVRKTTKNGPKKQPQRGLGVAQLEKLRLQEQQSKLCSAFQSSESLNGFIPGLRQSHCYSMHQQHHLLVQSQSSSELIMNTTSKENLESRAVHQSCFGAFQFDSPPVSLVPDISSRKDLIHLQSGPPCCSTSPVMPSSRELSSFQIDHHHHHHQHLAFEDTKCKRPRLDFLFQPKNMMLPAEQHSMPGGPNFQVEKPVMLTTWIERDCNQPDKLVPGTCLNDSTTLGNSCSSGGSSSPKPIPGFNRLNSAWRSDSGSFSEAEIESAPPPLNDFLALGLSSSSNSSRGSDDDHVKEKYHLRKFEDVACINPVQPVKKFSDVVSLDLSLRLSI